MTWEEWMDEQHARDADPNWSYDATITFREESVVYRQLLKAFADELVKRIETHQYPRTALPEAQGIVLTLDIKDRINQLLTEAGVER